MSSLKKIASRMTKVDPVTGMMKARSLSKTNPGLAKLEKDFIRGEVDLGITVKFVLYTGRGIRLSVIRKPVGTPMAYEPLPVFIDSDGNRRNEDRKPKVVLCQ